MLLHSRLLTFPRLAVSARGMLEPPLIQSRPTESVASLFFQPFNTGEGCVFVPWKCWSLLWARATH
jgi:hypothetical protein